MIRKERKRSIVVQSTAASTVGFIVGGVCGTIAGIVQNFLLSGIPLKSRILLIGKQSVLCAFGGSFFLGVLTVLKY